MSSIYHSKNVCLHSQVSMFIANGFLQNSRGVIWLGGEYVISYLQFINYRKITGATEYKKFSAYPWGYPPRSQITAPHLFT